MPEKPQCEAEVWKTDGNWTRSYRCPNGATRDVDGHALCGTHARVARTRAAIYVVTDDGGSMRITVAADPALVAADRERKRQLDRAANEQSPWHQLDKFRRIATMAINRLRANGIEADDLAEFMTAHPDDVPALEA